MSQKPIKPLPGFVILLIILGVIGIVYVLPGLFPSNSALYDAIEKKDEAQVRELLKDKADPNSRTRGIFAFRSSRYQFPPLLFSIYREQPGITRLLLEAGANPNARDPQGIPALIAAANAGKTEIVQALIEKGADVHAASTLDGETPLHHGPKGPGGRYPGWGNRPKDLKPEIKAMLEQAGAK